MWELFVFEDQKGHVEKAKWTEPRTETSQNWIDSMKKRKHFGQGSGQSSLSKNLEVRRCSPGGGTEYQKGRSGREGGAHVRNKAFQCKAEGFRFASV